MSFLASHEILTCSYIINIFQKWHVFHYTTQSFFPPLTALNICRLFFVSQFTVSRFWMSRVSGAGTGTLEEQLGWSK